MSSIATSTALVLLGAGLIALAAQVALPLPFTPVPLTGQTYAVLLVGASLGAVRGGAAASVYLAVGLAGAPVFADGTSGVHVVAGATGGYLIGFVVAAAATGYLAEREWDRRLSSSIGAMLTGNVIVYVIGLSWLSVNLHTDGPRTLELGLYPFVPGDIVKVYLAAITLPAAWRVARRAPRWATHQR